MPECLDYAFLAQEKIIAREKARVCLLITPKLATLSKSAPGAAT
jgi:hypothetical protein